MTRSFTTRGMAPAGINGETYPSFARAVVPCAKAFGLTRARSPLAITPTDCYVRQV